MPVFKIHTAQFLFIFSPLTQIPFCSWGFFLINIRMTSKHPLTQNCYNTPTQKPKFCIRIARREKPKLLVLVTLNAISLPVKLFPNMTLFCFCQPYSLRVSLTSFLTIITTNPTKTTAILYAKQNKVFFNQKHVVVIVVNRLHSISFKYF